MEQEETMIVACHQPNYLPWSGFFYKALRADRFILLDGVQFPRRARWANRNRIKNEQGELWLTVPIWKKRRGLQKIRSVEVCYERSWARKHFQSLCQHYSHAPYFNEHIHFFEDLYSRRWKFLVDINVDVIRYLGETMGVANTFSRQSSIGIEGTGSALLVDLCRAVGGDTYLADVASKKYLDGAAFAAAGVSIAFYRYKPPVYPQLWGHFIENLSSIDLLFNCGPKSRQIIEKSIPSQLQ